MVTSLSRAMRSLTPQVIGSGIPLDSLAPLALLVPLALREPMERMERRVQPVQLVCPVRLESTAQMGQPVQQAQSVPLALREPTERMERPALLARRVQLGLVSSRAIYSLRYKEQLHLRALLK